MGSLRRLGRAAHMSTIGRRRWRREITTLRASGKPASVSIADALTATLDDQPDKAELAWRDKIERLRRELYASQQSMGDTTIGNLAERASKPYLWALLLFRLVRAFRPERCLELGTAFGLSAAYQTAALELNGSGRLLTLEGSAERSTMAQGHFEALGLSRVEVRVGRFQDTLTDALQTLQPVDYAFVDGHHDEQATLAYFEQILANAAPQSLLVFDDISWSPGMKRAWSVIRADRRILACADLTTVGICVFVCDR